MDPLILSMAKLLTSWLASFTWSGSDRTLLLIDEAMCWNELVDKKVGGELLCGEDDETTPEAARPWTR